MLSLKEKHRPNSGVHVSLLCYGRCNISNQLHHASLPLCPEMVICSAASCQVFDHRNEQSNWYLIEKSFTKDSQLCRVAVSFSHHIGAHTGIHSCITFPGIGDHQFPTTDLYKINIRKRNGKENLINSFEHLRSA